MDKNTKDQFKKELKILLSKYNLSLGLDLDDHYGKYIMITDNNDSERIRIDEWELRELECKLPIKNLNLRPTPPLTMELYYSPQRDANIEKYGETSDTCICCGKPMKKGESKMVHMNEQWVAVNPAIVTEENCEQLTGYKSQGWFKIGNSCAKKMKGFIL